MMVYVSFPKQLSEQEMELKRKFAKLKKLKKQLAALKAAHARPAEESKKQGVKKITSDAAEIATEQAKKLLKAGAIKLDTATKAKQFKRARVDRMSTKEGVDRQISVAGYQPYNDTQEGSETDSSSVKYKRMSLAESFIPSSSRYDTSQPRRGMKVYVRGDGATEELVRETFSKAGVIRDVNRDKDKSAWFVTFDTAESADEAVSQFNGSLVGGVKLEVEIARRQGGVHLGHREAQMERKTRENTVPAIKRDIVNYDDEDLF